MPGTERGRGGIDIDSLAKEYPAIDIARAQVAFVHEVANLLREMRKKGGLTQAQLAELLGVTQPRIAQIESGKPGDAASLEQIAGYAYFCHQPVSLKPTPSKERLSV